MNLTRKLFQIVIVLVGCILGSLATLHTSIIPTQVDVVNNNDVQVRFWNSGSPLTSINVAGKSMLPLHEESGTFYYSPTLSMDDLNTDSEQMSENLFTTTREVNLDKNISNICLQVDLELSGDDEMNKAVRAYVKCGNNRYYLSYDEPSVVCYNIGLSKSAKEIEFTLWYELDNENCTIENINAAGGSNVQFKLYGFAKE